jgi:hypothetical protein
VIEYRPLSCKKYGSRSQKPGASKSRTSIKSKTEKSNSKKTKRRADLSTCPPYPTNA